MKESKFEDQNVRKVLEQLKTKKNEFILGFLKTDKLIKECKLSELFQKAISMDDTVTKLEKPLSSQTLPLSSIKGFSKEQQLQEDHEHYRSAMTSLEELINGFEDLLSDFNPKCNGPSTLQKMKELVSKHKGRLKELTPKNSFSQAYNPISILVGRTSRTTTMDYVENLISEMEKLVFSYKGVDITIKSEGDWEVLSIDEDWEMLPTGRITQGH